MVVMFQSPSLRGSGRFEAILKRLRNVLEKFQSPSLRGSGRFDGGFDIRLSPDLRFNPLHCGAVVASLGLGGSVGVVCLLVSIPFIAGQWSLLGELIGLVDSFVKFQSPSLRGSGRFRL